MLLTLRRFTAMRKFWPFSFYFLFFAALAAYMPFLVIFYQQLGFSGAEIGLLTGISPLVTMVTVPFWTNAADRMNRHRLIMSVSMLVSVAMLVCYPFLRSFAAILAITLLLNIFLAPPLSFANSAAMFMLGDEKELYGRVRVGGTFGFGTATLIAGFAVERWGLAPAFWLGAAFALLGFLISLQLEYGPEAAVLETAEPAEKSDSGLGRFLRDPNWLFLLIFAFMAGIGMAILTSYFYPYMAELGASQSAMGVANTIGTIAEVPVLLLANHFIKRFRPYGTLILALALTGVRLALFGLVDSTLAVFFIQLLNGLTIPLFIVAGVSIADKYTPQGLSSTGQGLFNSAMMGFGSAVGNFLGGALLALIGGQALYLYTGLAIMGVLPLVLLLRSRLLGKPLLAGT